MPGREKRRNSFCLGRLREMDSGLLFPQSKVAQDQMHLGAFEHRKCFIKIVDRRNDLVSCVAEHRFIIEGGQRLVLDNEDPLDHLLTLAEQHLDPEQYDSTIETNNSTYGAAAEQDAPHCASRATAPRGKRATDRQAAGPGRSRVAPR